MPEAQDPGGPCEAKRGSEWQTEQARNPFVQVEDPRDERWRRSARGGREAGEGVRPEKGAGGHVGAEARRRAVAAAAAGGGRSWKKGQ